jgi:hypothetical protein
MKDVDPDAMVAIVNYAYTGINLNLASISWNGQKSKGLECELDFSSKRKLSLKFKV